MRRSNVSFVLFEDTLQLIVLFLGVPVPFVNLLEFEAALFGEVFQLLFRGLSFGIFVQFLQLVNLISAFSRSFEADKSRSVLRTFTFAFVSQFFRFWTLRSTWWFII